MSLLKQMQHNNYVRILESTSDLKTEWLLRSRAVLSSPFQANLGILLLSLKLFIVTTLFLIVTCILSLWLLIILMWTKFTELLTSTKKKASTAQSTSCPLEDDQKNTDSTQDESQNWQWSEAGAIPPDFTSTSSATPGARKDTFKNNDPDPYITNIVRQKNE